ncbi:MAG: hypothetical protein DRI34_04355 [Deltaproteobacteria bacterium]|nr:MAG: hypothetical protein DRI34_04355 [Deltaproteobacteria bacterium]
MNPPVLAIDPVQVDMYAEAVPFGLLQIGTFLRNQGHEVLLVDMMASSDDHPGGVLGGESFYGVKPAGASGAMMERVVYLYGRDLDWLMSRLPDSWAPDEIWMTCCISFNYEPAFSAIDLLRRLYPRARILLGGNYPSLFPEHAARSGANVVHRGPFRQADGYFPELDLLEHVPPIWLFRLVRGCRYRCSFCANSARTPELAGDPVQVAEEILQVHRRWGVKTFSNWDPNVLLIPKAVEEMLRILIEAKTEVEIKFEMGLQPNRLTPDILELMNQAGVTMMTIPFESVEAHMLRRFGKPFELHHPMDIVASARINGFDTHRLFHCTWVIGIRDESFRHVFGTYFAILKAGGLPTPFPLSPTPGTREYTRHRASLAGKDLSELNGHLWPCQPSAEMVVLYDTILDMVSKPDPHDALELADRLSPRASRYFNRAFEWYLEGPYEPGRDPQPPPED